MVNSSYYQLTLPAGDTKKEKKNTVDYMSNYYCLKYPGFADKFTF